jgi:hypothetical protein
MLVPMPTPSPQQFVMSLQSRPSDRMSLEFDSDAITIVWQPLAINHSPASPLLVQRGNLHHFARLPEVRREYASAVRTYVIGERPLFSIGARRLTVRETHYDDDRQPPFYSATGRIVQRGLAQSLTRKTGGAAAGSFGLRTLFRVLRGKRLTIGSAMFPVRGPVLGPLSRCLEAVKLPHISIG